MYSRYAENSVYVTTTFQPHPAFDYTLLGKKTGLAL